MDSSNASIKTSLLEDDRLSSLRRRNRSIILVVFTLIIVLAIIIGAIIISLVHKHNSRPQEFNPSPAIREYCAPSSHSQFSCITALYSDVKTPPNAHPDQIFILSTETTVRDLSTIISMASNDTRSELPYGNCTSSLSHAAGQLGEVLGTIRVNPDVETQTYEERGDLIKWIAVALGDLSTCLTDLRKAESTATILEVNHKLYASGAVLRYSKDFLENCEFVNDNFRFAVASEESERNQVVWDLIGSSLFGLQYFVLVILFWLILRKYY